MDLLILGIVLLLLFVATYSQRRTWVTLGSTTLSIVLIAGCAFFWTAQGSSQIHEGFVQLAKSLPAGWDQPALKLASSVEDASAALARARQRSIDHDPQPVVTASISRWFTTPKSSPEAPVQEPEYAPAPLTARADPETAPESPIKWLLDTRPREPEKGFLVNGANVSDLPLKAVRAVLKPDLGGRKILLALAVEGPNGSDSSIVPPGARFTLTGESGTPEEAEQVGGAILSFAYVQAGRRKTSIIYLPSPALAQAPPTD